MPLPSLFLSAINKAHSSWHEALLKGLTDVTIASPGYLESLASTQFLPTQDRLFAAFSIPLNQIKYVLVGEGPYPREASANGYCFMDGAVGCLWSDVSSGGLSKQVNRATSLRNFIKMLLVADGLVTLENLSAETLVPISMQAKKSGSLFIQTLADMQENLLDRKFLLLNASLVFRTEVSPIHDAKAWEPFLRVIFDALSTRSSTQLENELFEQRPCIILWGKIAERLIGTPSIGSMRIVRSEHPYNISFIGNREMRSLFAPLKLLYR